MKSEVNPQIFHFFVVVARTNLQYLNDSNVFPLIKDSINFINFYLSHGDVQRVKIKLQQTPPCANVAQPGIKSVNKIKTECRPVAAI